jgi:hypothetical protein
MYGYEFSATLTTNKLLQIADRSSRQRGRQDEEQSNFPAEERKNKYLAMGPKGVPETKMDSPTDCRSQHQLNLTLLFILILEVQRSP